MGAADLSRLGLGAWPDDLWSDSTVSRLWAGWNELPTVPAEVARLTGLTHVCINDNALSEMSSAATEP